jgi:hypothetical protein
VEDFNNVLLLAIIKKEHSEFLGTREPRIEGRKLLSIFLNPLT